MLVLDMKKLSASVRAKQETEIIAACERTRQACNRLSNAERRELREAALTIIHGCDAKVSHRSH